MNRLLHGAAAAAVAACIASAASAQTTPQGSPAPVTPGRSPAPPTPAAPPAPATPRVPPAQAAGAVAPKHLPPAPPALVAAMAPYFQVGTKRDQALQRIAPLTADLFMGGDTMSPETLKASERLLEARYRASRGASVMAADIDNDGKVTREEFESYLRSKPGMTADQVKAVADQVFRMSKDGKSLTYEDLRVAPVQGVSNSQSARVGKAALGDAKTLSKAAFDDLALAALDAVDTNKDGVIELNEFLASRPSAPVAPGTPVPSRTGGAPTVAPTPPTGK